MHRAFLVLLLMTSVVGCVKDFGTGGTGELVIPQRELREVKAGDLSALATTRPTTSVATQPATQPAPAELALTIEECRQFALASNLNLQVELLNPSIARQSLSEEEARYEAIFSANLSYAKTDSPTATELVGSQTETVSADAGITLPLRTGGSLKLDVPANRFETDNQFSTLNPAYTGNYVVSFSQPLLRGAGFGVNAQPIRVAFYGYQQTQARTKLEVIRVLADVDRVYWRLYAARRELEVRKQEHELAVAQLDRANRELKAGKAAGPEIVRAESGVADRVEAVILAENAVRDRQRDLKRIINKPGLEMETPTILIPATKPGATFYKLDPGHVTRIAIRQRMEMLDLELQIASDTSNVAFAKNGMLPLVTFDYQYNINGLGETLADAFSMASNKDFEDHRLGLHLEVPIGNEAARSRYRRALLTRMQTLATKEARIAQITQEVLNALDQLEANWQRILAARQRVVLASRLLDVEIRQFGVGLRTSTDVLDAQAKLASAASSEISAITEYQIAQVDIAFATGTVLGASKIVWDPITLPAKSR